MATIIRMPGVLAGAEEAALAGWLVAVGDTVAVGDPLAEIETEKATVEYTAEFAGVLGRTLIAAGDSSEVGAPIAVLVAAGEGDAEIDAILAGTDAPIVKIMDAPEVEVVVVEGDEPGFASIPGERRFASPLARRLARERGLDLSLITGTGPGGRICRRDIESFVAVAVAVAPVAVVAASASVSGAAPSSGSASESDWDEIPHTGMRKAIARRLTESKSTVPHFYLTAECRVDALLALRSRINETSPVRISVNDLVVKAAAAAFADVPDANVTWTETALRRHRTIDISVAVATDGGLMTPVLRDVGVKSLTAVSTEISALAIRARKRRLRQDELEGGSFSVTNLGMYGTLEFAAILNPPQSGILAVGAATEQAVVDEHGTIVVATVMRCTLSVDHRAIDGALAAQWLAAFTRRIENPFSVLI